MKKNIPLLLSGVIALLVLSACNGGKPETGPDPAAVIEQAKQSKDHAACDTLDKIDDTAKANCLQAVDEALLQAATQSQQVALCNTIVSKELKKTCLDFPTALKQATDVRAVDQQIDAAASGKNLAACNALADAGSQETCVTSVVYEGNLTDQKACAALTGKDIKTKCESILTSRVASLAFEKAVTEAVKANSAAPCKALGDAKIIENCTKAYPEKIKQKPLEEALAKAIAQKSDAPCKTLSKEFMEGCMLLYASQAQ